MKRYTLSAADSFTHRPEHPERTARRNCRGVLNFDVMYQVWPNRAAMLKTISLQDKRESRPDDWRPVQPQYAPYL